MTHNSNTFFFIFSTKSEECKSTFLHLLKGKLFLECFIFLCLINVSYYYLMLSTLWDIISFNPHNNPQR